jgi:class 3 adenylate cyclase
LLRQPATASSRSSTVRSNRPVQYRYPAEFAWPQRITAKHHWIEYRIGAQSGDAIIEADDIYGDGVNISRLEGIADPGGVASRRNLRADKA